MAYAIYVCWPSRLQQLVSVGVCARLLVEQVGALAAIAVVPADVDVAVPVRVQQLLQLVTVFCVKCLGGVGG